MGWEAGQEPNTVLDDVMRRSRDPNERCGIGFKEANDYKLEFEVNSNYMQFECYFCVLGLGC